MDNRLRELDKELEAKKIRFQNERLRQSILDDPTWLSPRRGTLNSHYTTLLSRLQDFSQSLKDDLDARRPLPSIHDPMPPPKVTSTATNFVRSSMRKEPQQQTGEYYATLPVGAPGPTTQQVTGRGPTDSAKRRQKAQYRDELLNQMELKEQARAKEKLSDMQTQEVGLLGTDRQKPVVASHQSHPLPKKDDVSIYHSKILETLSPRSEVVLGRSRLEDFDRDDLLRGPSGRAAGLSKPFSLSQPSAIRGSGGTYSGIGSILDTGFDKLLLDPPQRISSLDPPPGLKYEPASYITQGAGAGLHNSVDEAYNFYATRDPLNSNSFTAAGGGFGGGGVVSGRLAADQEISFAGGAGGSRSRVHFDDQRHQGDRANRVSAMDFPTDDDKKRQQRAAAQSYQEELNRQIEEKKKKKQLEREERERYERKLEQEAKEYSPFGRIGGGAPNRDSFGNIIADLRQMHHTNDPEGPTGNVSYRSPRKPAAPTSVRDDLIKTPPVQTTAEGEQSFARGGHGIFGMPKTDAEKIQADRYKDELRRQIEEKRLEELRKREEERRAEEREMQRVQEQQLRMQEEYEEERRKIRQKEEEARRKNEELVREAEERKREAERKKKEAEAERLEELIKERELDARLEKDEHRSPAVPTLRQKESDSNKARETRTKSPVVPAARIHTAEPDAHPSTSARGPSPVVRSQSADVLNQLAAMKQQLQNERQRVESMLNTDRNEPDVFDPRLVQRPPPAPVMYVKSRVDIFETARTGNAVAVRRTPADRANLQAVADFSALKNKDDSDSRKEFRSMFPELPLTGDSLEAQQAALLQQQEENLKHLRERIFPLYFWNSASEQSLRPLDLGSRKPAIPRSPRVNSHTPKQLHANSAFVDVENFTYLPDDFEDMPASNRNESARARRRGHISPRVTNQGSSDPFGSTVSLNVDRLAKKNENRLKRLRDLQGDDLSLYDPDDVLDRFMSKQAHNRPPSGLTLQDDTWMFTGAASKVSGY
ncbi:centrosome and spindle pole associated protein 1-like [Pomacea canaliculata]|uniref:centrosome and spindle pole associated protein 1-like n=1 Tax=Pomacea canaliculata TaxID=400727 RepID=UPI000D735338|nr:centrosome and spindle pole associated protein 1-like [Pomacea canaliculata]